jgi:Domain of unknown function (DUF4926)
MVRGASIRSAAEESCMTLPEYSSVIVTRDIPEAALAAGDVSGIVMIHEDANKAPIGYILEIIAVNGDSLDIVSVRLNDVRAASDYDLTLARSAAYYMLI